MNDHYKKGIEVYKFINSWNLNFNRGNVIKYVIRAGIKNKAEELSDIEKAMDYLAFERERILNEIQN